MSSLFNTIYKRIVEKYSELKSKSDNSTEFYLPTSNEQFEKLIEISKDQLTNNSKNNDDNNITTKSYYKHLKINRNIKTPNEGFLIPSIPVYDNCLLYTSPSPRD